MIFKNIEQNTEEWHELRNRSVTSTDAAIINGTNTFRGNSPFKLWQKKMELIDEEPVNAVMMEGITLEEEARNQFNDANNVLTAPAMVYNPDNPWHIASLDGYHKDLDYILEIKCGAKAYEQAQKGDIPSYYFDQMQHALFSSGKDYCNYICYRIARETIIIPVKRDDYHIERLFDKEKEFYQCIKDKIAPAFTERDYVPVDDEGLKKLEEEWMRNNSKLKELKEKDVELRSKMGTFGDDGNFKGYFLKFTRVQQTRTDYKKAAVESGVDLTPYTKIGIGYYRITELV